MKRGDDSFFSLFQVLNISLASTVVGFIVVLSFFWNINWQISMLMLVSIVINLFFARFLVKNSIEKRDL
jgi:hypothetical protein